MTDQAALLSARGVEKAFGPTPALRGVDLRVGRGEIVAVMGASGSGKSTLLHCVAGVLRPDAGEIRFDGRRVDTMSDDQRSTLRRSQFGFVFQFGQLVGELTAAENVALPLLLGGAKRRTAMATAGSWLESFGVGELLKRRPHEMSGGQAQRIALARALATEPRVVFADEPTGSLDSVAGAAVLDMLVSAARSCAVSVVMVTHEERVAAYADRIVTPKDGQLVAPSAVSEERPCSAWG